MAEKSRLRRILIGKPRDILHPRTWHSVSLIAVLAWVGLGADPLSSSAYGPDEAFRALGAHTYLAIALALATTITVVTLSLAYSQIIAHFPFGGGGYTVATELLSPSFGVISGSALIVDYILTISVSIASAGDQLFSAMPSLVAFKLPFEFFAIAILVILNLRGVRESVTILAPIFALFVITHIILIAGALGSHLGEVPRVAHEISTGFDSGLKTLGAAGLFGVFVAAYAMGGGTYTGIEAVSNGLPIMREPKVATARRTMIYIAVSLAITASGLLIAYLLFGARPEAGKTLNAVLLERFAGGWRPGGLPAGVIFVTVTLIAEAALLVVAAQAGFLDGPRVMSNMARDHWLPHRFTQLSERLTVQDGVLLMGGAAIATLAYARGNITTLVTMYSINIFITFSLSQLGMVRFWLRERRARKRFRRGLAINSVALVMCVGILAGTIYHKANHGGWVTIMITGGVIGLCFWIRRYYRQAQQSLKRLDDLLPALPAQEQQVPPVDTRQPTAVLFVGGYTGLGIHALLTIQRLFPGHFKNVVFISVGVIDAAVMKGVEEVERLREATKDALLHYVELARRLGWPADFRMQMGTEAVEAGESLAVVTSQEFPRAIFFLGNLVFQRERWFHRLLHNQTAYRLQRRLQFAGLNAMVLPVRVLENGRTGS